MAELMAEYLLEAVYRSALDPGRAAIHLGWKPWTPLDDGLAITVDWFRDQPG